MACAGRRRRFRDRLAWIRHHTGSKQRGTKLRSSSSESDRNPKAVVEPVFRGGNVVSKHALKLGGGGDDEICSPKLASSSPDVNPERAVGVGDGGDGGSCGPNMGTCGCDGSPKKVVEVRGGSDDVIRSRHQIRKRVLTADGGGDGTCSLNLGGCGGEGRNVRGCHIERGRLRVDCDGQLYVLDSETEDSALEESCLPELRRGGGGHVRRLAATGEVTLQVGKTKGTAIGAGDMTPKMIQCMEVWLAGIEEGEDREVLSEMIKVALTNFYAGF